MALTEVKFNRKYTSEQLLSGKDSSGEDIVFTDGTYYQPKGSSKIYYYADNVLKLVGEKNNFSSITLGSTPYTSGALVVTPGAIGAYTKSEVDVKIDEKVGSVYKYKGSVANRSALTDKIGTSADGDVWNVEEDGMNYAFIANGTGRKYANCTLSISSKINGKQCTGSSGQYFYDGDVVEVYDADYKKEDGSALSIGTLTVAYIDSKSALGMVANLGTTTYYLKSELAEGTDLVMTTNVANAYTLTTHTESGAWDALGGTFDTSVLVDSITALSTELETLEDALGTGATKDAGNGVGNVPEIGTSLASKSGYPVLLDANGKLKPGTAALGYAAYADIVGSLTSDTNKLPTSKAVKDAVDSVSSQLTTLSGRLGTAASCNKATEVTSGGTGLPTAGAVYNFVNEASEISKDLFLFGKGHDIFAEFIEGSDFSSYYNSTTKYYEFDCNPAGAITEEDVDKYFLTALDANKLIEEQLSGYGRKSIILFDGVTCLASYNGNGSTFNVEVFDGYHTYFFKLTFNASYNGWQQFSFRMGGAYGASYYAEKLEVARTINGISFDGSANVSNFFVCETPGDSDCKFISAPGITKATGARIVVKFTNSCENISNRVELTINNNISSASPIVLGDGTNVMEHLVAGVYDMVYDGANWVILSGCGSKTYWEE